MYQRQYGNGSSEGCFYNSNLHAGGQGEPRDRRTSRDGSLASTRRAGGLSSFNTEEETERPHATGPSPFRLDISIGRDAAMYYRAFFGRLTPDFISKSGTHPG